MIADGLRTEVSRLLYAGHWRVCTIATSPLPHATPRRLAANGSQERKIISMPTWI